VGCRSPQPLVHAPDLYEEGLRDFRRGNLVSAQERVDRATAVWQDKPASEEYWTFRALKAEILVNQGLSRAALSLLENHPPDTVEFRAAICRIKTVRVKALLRLQMIDEAETALDEVEALVISSGQHALMPEIGVLRGVILGVRQRPVEAEASYHAALRHAEERNDLYWRTVILNNLGMTRVRQLRWDEAMPYLVRAHSGFESMDAKLYAAIALGNIALSAGRLGDFERASSAFAEAITAQERENAKPYLQATLGEFGNLYALQEEHAEAIPFYRRALAIALEIEETRDASKWAGNLSTMLANAKEWDEAEKFNQLAFQLKERIKDTDSQIFTRLNSASIAAGRGRFDVAEDLYLQLLQETDKNSAVLWDAHAGLAQLYETSGKKDLAFKHFDAAIAAIEAGRNQLSRTDYKITFLSRLIRFYQKYVDALIDAGDSKKALRVTESSRALVLAEKFSRQTPAGRSAADYSQMAKRSGTSFLVYWLAPRRSLLWVITPRGQEVFILPPRAEIEALAQSYQSLIDGLRDPLQPVPSTAERLYNILLAPARDLTPSGSHVVVVPDGGLHNINFETLLVPSDKPHYWIEDVTVAVAPALSVNPGIRARGSLQSFLLIGDPESPSPDYPALPYAEVEVRNVQRRLASLKKTVYEGARAEPSAYASSDPGKYSVIHFAAHASANRESPLDSAIILSPSNGEFKLYARDILKQSLQAELVTISACRGAGARVYSGEGLVGFAWAFLQAGASNVIAGLWDVTDSSTAQLMDRLYQEIDSGKSPAEALRQAKLSMLQSPGSFRKPYYWGAFQVYVGTK
jgi:CHAT domain-containing protein/Tfp pilus assembly protein PilF